MQAADGLLYQRDETNGPRSYGRAIAYGNFSQGKCNIRIRQGFLAQFPNRLGRLLERKESESSICNSPGSYGGVHCVTRWFRGTAHCYAKLIFGDCSVRLLEAT